MPIFGTVKEFGGESLLLTTEAQALQLDEQLMRSQIENKKLQDLLLHTHTHLRMQLLSVAGATT